MHLKVNISNDGDNWTVGYKIAHRVMMMSFTIGEEFDDMKPFSEEVSKVIFGFYIGENLDFAQTSRSLQLSMRRKITWNLRRSIPKELL